MEFRASRRRLMVGSPSGVLATLAMRSPRYTASTVFWRVARGSKAALRITKFTEILRIIPARTKMTMSCSGAERWDSSLVNQVPTTAPTTMINVLADENLVEDG